MPLRWFVCSTDEKHSLPFSVRDVKEKTDGYGGELTGVKTSVIKSRKFN